MPGAFTRKFHLGDCRSKYMMLKIPILKIPLKKCNAMSGDAQSQCKKEVDADSDATKANAKAAEVSKKE